MAAPKVPTNAELLASIQAGTVKKKEAGIGYMWNTTTGAVGKSFAVVGNFATAAEVFSQQAVQSASLNRIESSQELCASMGIEAQGFEAIKIAQAITEYIVSQ